MIVIAVEIGILYFDLFFSQKTVPTETRPAGDQHRMKMREIEFVTWELRKSGTTQ
jgi:hypothetical protein